ncbi:hypothetical protein DM02DRAFT_619851 [Periconia macrospinosa]|uniref:Rhodopsin domain-containing protein n=1 Tax=Periconia macrospinosa TaxID=97972 RepID=A0A2V1D3H5_9PLEO|nr:hypothetical protein DM02DRAFT_619851 [Periconia macrospinosa]
MVSSVAPEAVIPIEAVLMVLAIFLASARIVTRLLQRQYPTVSDSFLIASVLNTIGLFITDALTYKYGGMEDYDPNSPVPPVEVTIALKKVQFAGNNFYDTGIYLPKLAILALYYRLIPATLPWLRKSLVGVTVFTGCAMITTCFLDAFWCGRDVSVNWSPEEDSCNTFASKEVFRVDWAMNIVSDICIFTLPFPLLHRLQLNRRQLWGLIVTFSLGAITISVSIARFATIEVIHAWTNVFVLSMAEMAVAIMVVALPSMRSFLRSGSFFSTNHKAYGISSSSRPSAYGQHSSLGDNGPSHLFSTSKVMSSARGGASARRHHQNHLGEYPGSEVELNQLERNDVIYETVRVSVQFSNSDAGDTDAERKKE